MTSSLDFMINYMSDDEHNTSDMFVSASKSYKINKSSNSVPQIKKIGLIYISIAILFFLFV